jgi:hypothetical protein
MSNSLRMPRGSEPPKRHTHHQICILGGTWQLKPANSVYFTVYLNINITTHTLRMPKVQSPVMPQAILQAILQAVLQAIPFGGHADFFSAPGLTA